MENFIRKSFYLIIPVLIWAGTQGFAPFAVCLLALGVLLFNSNRHTIGVFLMMYGGVFGGVIRMVYPFLPVYGVLLQALGIALVWDVIAELFMKRIQSFLLLLLTLLLFGFYYVYGPQDAFAREKYITMWIYGFVTFFGYFTLVHSTKIKIENLAQILIIASICLYAFVISTYSLVPGDLFNFNWFREQTSIVNRQESILVNHQQIAMLVVYGLAVVLSQTKVKLTAIAYYTLCSFLLVMISGCRQAIFGVLFVAAARIFFFRIEYANNRQAIARFFWIIFGVGISYFVISYIVTHTSSYMMNLAVTEGDSERSMLFMAAISLFNSNPLLGVGLGGYQALTTFLYPHNMVLELMCECGTIGLIVFGLLMIVPLFKSKVRLLQLTASNQFFFLVFFALFIRIMVSADLKESISVFSALFAIASVSRQSLLSRKFRLKK